jgi:hypothetical protein
MPNLTSLGEAASVDELYVGEIFPLVGNDIIGIQTPVNFKNGSSVVAEVTTVGDINTLGKVSLYSGTNLGSVYTRVNRYSVKLDSNFDFVIYDNVNGAPRITINATTGATTFNPPIGGTSIGLSNIDLVNSNVYLLFSPSSSTGTISTVDTTNNITYNPVTDTLTFGNLNCYNIVDNTSSTGTAGQVLTAIGSGNGISWATSPAINNGTLTITNGTHITGSGIFTANQSGPTSITIATDATDLNTFSTIIARDSGGNFSAGTMTGTSTKVDLNNVLLSNLYYNVALGSTIGGSPYGSHTIGIGDNTLTFNPVTGILGCVTIQAYLDALFLTGMYSGMYNFLHLGQSANLLTVLPDAVGTGLAVFNNSPTLITPALGTPSALVGTNITGTGLGFTSGTTANVNTTANTSSVILYPTMVIIPTTATSQMAYTNANFSYSPTTSTLSSVNLSLLGTLADAKIGRAHV